MGDRCLVVVTDGKEIAPAAIYTHWMGQTAPHVIEAAGEAGLLRAGDVSYATARLCGHFHDEDREPLGMGLLPPPGDLEPETLKNYSHGDAGVIVVNVKDGAITYAGGGYHERSPKGLPTTVKLYRG